MRTQSIASITAAVLFSLGAGAQVPVSPTEVPGVTAPAPQAHTPQGGGRQPLTSPIDKSPGTLPQVQILNGVLMGYVYWDGSTIQYNVNAPCSFQVRINQGTPPRGGGMGFEQFTEFGTFKNNFTSVGKVGNYVVCEYAVDHLPEGKDLQVQVGPTKGAFQTAVVFTVPPTANDPNRPIKISGGKCNQLPPAVPSSSTLGSAWWTCGDHAYNVNYLMQPPQNIPGLTQNPGTLTVVQSQTLLPAGGGTNGMLNTNPQQKTLLSGSGPTTGMINPGPQQNPGAANPGPVQNPGAVNPGPIGMATPASGRNADDLNPQPYPPHSISSVGSSSGVSRAKITTKTSALAAIRLGAPQQSRKITNPNAGMQNTEIIAVLQKQTHAAEGEIAAMKLSLRPAGVQVGSGASRTMAATGSGGGPGAGSAPVQANLLAGSTPSAGHTSIGAVLPAQFQNLAITCSHDATMRVLTVSGMQTSGVFTQDAKYNFYTISGCSFGDPGPNAKAYIYSQGTFREDFQIEQWSDNWIKLSIDSNLKGIDDQDNVTLVIQREDGTQASKGGFRFYAARETILLPKIPQSDFSLNRFRPDNSVTNSWTPTYTSGSSASVVPNLPGLSAEVKWNLTTGPNGTILGGGDIYDFSQLHSTFALQNALMEWKDVSCDGDYQLASSNNQWGIDWYGNAGVQVTWQGQTCNPKPGSCGGAFQGDCFEGEPESNYGVDVWVTGPRGVDPWTGKPTA